MSDNGILVTVSGPPAAGTSSLCDTLSNLINAKVISGGDIFRQIADERDLKPYQLSEIAENDDSIDKEIDDRLKNIISEKVKDNNSERIIIDSRLAGWHAEGDANLSVWLKAPIETRINRLSSRDETKDELKRREKSDARRYMEYYNINIDDMSVYDLVIDTDTFSERDTAKITKQALQTQVKPNELNILS